MATKEQQAKFQEIYTAAKNAGIQHPEVVAAQWAVESGWGKKQSGKNNYWGIKAGDGDPNNASTGSVVMTHEVINGKSVKMPQKFRDYETLEDALLDRAKFTSKQGGRYDKAGYFTASSPAEAAQALQKAGYATDPNYANTLISVMKSGGIDPFESSGAMTVQAQTTAPISNIAQTTVPQNNLSNLYANLFNPNVAQQSQTSSPQQSFLNPQQQIEDYSQLGKLPEIEDVIDTSAQYQKQLAQAFGIKPRASQGLPDYIGDLVRSIYDQA